MFVYTCDILKTFLQTVLSRIDLILLSFYAASFYGVAMQLT